MNQDSAPSAALRVPAGAPEEPGVLDTIVAVGTPSGEGAIGIVRLSGPQAIDISQSLVGASPDLQGLTPRHLEPVRLWEVDGHLLDRALATLYRSPRSYTGEDVVEIFCHGSPYVLRRTMELAVERGARLAQPGEFTLRAYLNGKMDLTQAEAVCRLIRSKTRAAHRVALGQMEGRLSRQAFRWKEGILDLLARAEAALDHAEEELPSFSWLEAAQRCRALALQISGTLQTFQKARRIQEGLRVALVGRPNVGKSSLFNRILGHERAIVAELPGTTRDTLEELMELEGIGIVWVDTAGIRSEGFGPVEQEGIERARAAIRRSDGIVWVLDRSQPLQREDFVVRDLVQEACREEKFWVCALNKRDLPERLRWNGFRPEDPIAVSAATGQGMLELLRRVSGWTQGSDREWGAVFLTELRHRQALERVAEFLEQAGRLFAPGEGQGELAAASLHSALRALGELVGETDSEEILGAVFSRFCIGK
ncbi:MAG: tRNA uridine-5-carboxymethylaminomethyl(34) synthesis GTPase MnmE [Elusimicrobia bacterium]|nr:tRNA uridine-5-carboxymethylaminomethyl(34) synthesis GTPase MnmE [Elusimicrobiota bacterium]